MSIICHSARRFLASSSCAPATTALRLVCGSSVPKSQSLSGSLQLTSCTSSLITSHKFSTSRNLQNSSPDPWITGHFSDFDEYNLRRLRSINTEYLMDFRVRKADESQTFFQISEIFNGRRTRLNLSEVTPLIEALRTFVSSEEPRSEKVKGCFKDPNRPVNVSLRKDKNILLGETIMIQQSSIEELCGIMEDVNKAREEFKSKEMA